MRARNVRFRSAPVALALALPALGLAGSAAAEPAPAAPAAEASCSWRQTGARLLAHAKGTATVTGEWCADNLSPAAVSALFDKACRYTRDSIDESKEFARDGVARGHGLFFCRRAGDGRTHWTFLAEACAVPQHVVVLVHGLDDPGTIWDDCAPALADAGHSVLSFHYPNDQSPRKSAVLLAEALRDLDRRGTKSIDIVAHSMGSLIVRDVLSCAEAYACEVRGCEGLPDVHRFIMLAPPNSGSPLARLRAVMEIRDQLERYFAADERDWRTLFGCFYDGDGEAGDDLLPGSAYLTELNGRPALRGVEQTIIVARLFPEAERWTESLTDSCALRCVFGAEAADDLHSALRGAFRALGDGAVPESSTALADVDDVVVLASNHRSMVRQLEPVEWLRDRLGMPPGPTPPAIPVILDRLEHDGHRD